MRVYKSDLMVSLCTNQAYRLLEGRQHRVSIETSLDSPILKHIG